MPQAATMRDDIARAEASARAHRAAAAAARGAMRAEACRIGGALQQAQATALQLQGELAEELRQAREEKKALQAAKGARAQLRSELRVAEHERQAADTALKQFFGVVAGQ
jgi:hypothetical protein